MSDLAAQLAAKFHTATPFGDDAPTSTTEDGGIDPRTAADPQLARLANLVAKVAGVEAATITRQTSLHDAAINSLARIELMVRAEEEFKVRLDDEQVLGMATVDDLLRYLEKQAQ